MSTMKIITIVCWIITAIVLIGLGIWFLTGSMVFGIKSDRWNLNLNSGFNIGDWEALSGPYEAVGVYTPGIEGINSLNINWVAGDVTVKPYDGKDFQITEFAQRELQDHEKLQINTANGTMTIKYRNSDASLRMPQKKLEVLIPQTLSKNLNKLSADTVSGDIFVDSINTDILDADSMSGTIQISNSNSQTLNMNSTSGSLTVEFVLSENMSMDSMSGDVQISGSTAKTLDCGTTSGNVNITGAFDSMNLSSMSGEVSVDNSTAGSAVKAGNTSGSLELSGSFDTVDSSTMSGKVSITSVVVPRKLKADSTSGDITVTIPNDGEITVNHSSTSGRFSSDIPVVIQEREAQFEISSMSGDTRILKLR